MSTYLMEYHQPCHTAIVVHLVEKNDVKFWKQSSDVHINVQDI